ncbi:DUF7529 family protein [Halovivax gelatinilyticus]|uniref:DUF7529 family protein n=1 Tax=Halovivax gelatinilyticus TaxID=2961597 RepID=UPI0020CA585F|nr:hypothetical protein [Halovivax gelatinilyticus]
MTDERPPDGEPESGDSGTDRADIDRAETEPWAELLGDAEAIASEYRAEGWTVERVDPIDVVPWADDDGGGFAILADGNRVQALESLVSDRTFGAAEVYQRPVDAGSFLVLVELDEPTERAIVLSLYYRREEAENALSRANEAGELQVRLRSTDGDDWLTFVHDDPSLFDADG